jgi:CRP-like cAMP-binding protein
MNTNTARSSGHRQSAAIGLPGGDSATFQSEEVIYSHETGPQHLYQLVEGQVTVALMSVPENPVILDICKSGDFFGEASLLGHTGHREGALVMRAATVTVWKPEVIEGLLEGNPRLAMQLFRVLTRRISTLETRITSLAVDKVPQRLARALIVLSDRLGHTRTDGDSEMPAMTHGVLAQYVGTSREIVTHHMNRLRRGQYIDYSRKTIRVRRPALMASLSGD